MPAELSVIMSVRRNVLGKPFQMVGPQTKKARWSNCVHTLNDGSSRCCRAQATSTRVTVVEGDEVQNLSSSLYIDILSFNLIKLYINRSGPSELVKGKGTV